MSSRTPLKILLVLDLVIAGVGIWHLLPDAFPSAAPVGEDWSAAVAGPSRFQLLLCFLLAFSALAVGLGMRVARFVLVGTLGVGSAVVLHSFSQLIVPVLGPTGSLDLSDIVKTPIFWGLLLFTLLPVGLFLLHLKCLFGKYSVEAASRDSLV